MKNNQDTRCVTDPFLKNRPGSGTQEWAEHTYSIEKGCPRGCHYCWARACGIQRGYIANAKAWEHPVRNEKKVSKGWRRHEGVIMFPGTHDITEANVEASKRVLRTMAMAGNYIVIVTKPYQDVIAELREELHRFRKQVLFRLTIGTFQEAVMRAWEPHASGPQERIQCLQDLYHDGFYTSGAIEPLLGGIQTAIGVIDLCAPFVTHDIWVGFMNKVDARTQWAPPEIETFREAIKQAQTPETASLIAQYARTRKDVLVMLKAETQAMANKRKELLLREG